MWGGPASYHHADESSLLGGPRLLSPSSSKNAGHCSGRMDCGTPATGCQHEAWDDQSRDQGRDATIGAAYLKA